MNEENVIKIDGEVQDEQNTPKIHLDNFEGPLDLLYSMIKENKLEIATVPVAVVTEQYLKALESMDLEHKMEKATELLAYATFLLEQKSKSLLPLEQLDDGDEYDPEDDPEYWRKQLMEYEMIKEQTEQLKNIENVNRFYREQSKSATSSKIVLKDFDYDKLLDAFAFLVSRVKEKEGQAETKTIKKDRFTVEDRMEFIRGIFKENDEITFFELFDDDFALLEIITVFSAILELVKRQEITVVQDEKYENITIRRKNKDDDEDEQEWNN